MSHARHLFRSVTSKTDRARAAHRSRQAEKLEEAANSKCRRYRSSNTSKYARGDSFGGGTVIAIDATHIVVLDGSRLDGTPVIRVHPDSPAGELASVRDAKTGFCFMDSDRVPYTSLSKKGDEEQVRKQHRQNRHSMDQNDDGVFSRREFELATRGLSPEERQQAMRDFNSMDQNRDGVISAAEFRRVLKQCRRGQPSRGQRTDGFHSNPADGSVSFSTMLLKPEPVIPTLDPPALMKSAPPHGAGNKNITMTQKYIRGPWEYDRSRQEELKKEKEKKKMKKRDWVKQQEEQLAEQLETLQVELQEAREGPPPQPAKSSSTGGWFSGSKKSPPPAKTPDKPAGPGWFRKTTSEEPPDTVEVRALEQDRAAKEEEKVRREAGIDGLDTFRENVLIGASVQQYAADQSAARDAANAAEAARVAAEEQEAEEARRVARKKQNVVAQALKIYNETCGAKPACGQVSDINEENHLGATPLFCVAKYGDNVSTESYREDTIGDVGLLVLLIEAGADVNARGESNATALHEAAYQGHLEQVQILLEAKADVNAHYSWRFQEITPLKRALEGSSNTKFIGRDWESIIGLLKEHGGT